MARRRTAASRRKKAGVHSETLLDLGRVKVMRFTLMPGACTPRHRHPCPFIVMPRTDGLIERVVHSGGKRQRARSQKLVAGIPYFRNVSAKGLEQTICNASDHPIMFEKFPICCDQDWDDRKRRRRRRR